MFDGTTGYGSVGYVYQIGRYEVTNVQYAEFLNTVAQSDPYQLYDPFMDRSQGFGEGSGIVRNGTAGSYTYTVDAGRENRPVNYVSVFDTMRFANWLNNGQGSGSTETGSYTLEGGTPTPTNYTVTRNPGLGIFLPTEDEWYKAAYYDAVSTSYFDWPTGTNSPTTCASPGPTPNTANCAGAGGNEQIVGGAYTDGGAYTGSPSPWGTYDQGGNVYDYTETLTGNAPTVGDDPPPVGPAVLRILRGSSYVDRQQDMAARFRRSVTADTNDPFMDRSQGLGEGSGIVQSGSPGSYTYTVDAGRENRPVNYVSVYDAMRFANWLHNGQESGDTETGAYTLVGGTPTPINGSTVTRNLEANIFLPTEDEWYKAAYYDAVTMTYFDWPAGSNTPTACATPGPTPNTANCEGAVGDLTDAGSYAGSASPYGTLDQGGNVFDYTETITNSPPGTTTFGQLPPLLTDGPFRVLRGGSHFDAQFWLAASGRNSITADSSFAAQGFRVASQVPEPNTGLLLMTGMLILAGRRRRLTRSER